MTGAVMAGARHDSSEWKRDRMYGGVIGGNMEWTEVRKD